MTTTDEVSNNKIYIKSNFDDIVSYGHLSVLLSISYVLKSEGADFGGICICGIVAVYAQHLQVCL